MILVVISRASIRCFQDGRIGSKDADEETSPSLLRPRFLTQTSLLSFLTADEETSPYWLCWRLEDAEEQTTGQPTAHSPHQTLSPQHTDEARTAEAEAQSFTAIAATSFFFS
jgi:hypothetical protein